VEALVRWAHPTLGHLTPDLLAAACAEVTPEQARWLRDCGCDEAQGWLYAKAAPLAALFDLIARR
jgi:EAL domain-containing protein (putative c-di-GMP-specific phosphodiesterase class I)